MNGLGWMDRAACVGLPPELFEYDNAAVEPHPAALATCAACPVREACAADAETLGAPGILRAGDLHASKHGVGGKVRTAVSMNPKFGTWEEEFGHGTAQEYRRGCRCPGCTEAHARNRHPGGPTSADHGRRQPWRTAVLNRVAT